MSYCRWSSDQFRCDLYVYEDVGGWWSTNVAGRRPWIPGPPFTLLTNPPRWLPTSLACRIYDWWETAMQWHHRNINGPHDGESFADDSPGACADRLEELRAAGYHFPAYVIPDLRRDQAELDLAETIS